MSTRRKQPSKDPRSRVTPGVQVESLRKFGPKPADHPSVGEKCPACDDEFRAGDFTTLITIGPGDNPEARWLAIAGHAYNAVAIEAHWACATGQEP